MDRRSAKFVSISDLLSALNPAKVYVSSIYIGVGAGGVISRVLPDRMGRSSRPASGMLVVDLGIDLPLSPFVKDFVENFEDKR